MAISLEEKRRRNAEYMRRKRAEKQEQAQEGAQEQKCDAPNINGLDPATVAALLNALHHYTVVLGECRKKRLTVIAEKMLGKSEPDMEHRYRLKVTTYSYFKTEGELKAFCVKNKIPMKYN